MNLAQVQTDSKQAEAACRSAEEPANEFRGMPAHPNFRYRISFCYPRRSIDGESPAVLESFADAERRLRESISLTTSILTQLAKNSSRERYGLDALIPNLRSSRSEAELELGLLLKSDPDRKAQSSDHFDRAVTELSALNRDFPRVSSYQNWLNIAKKARAELTPRP